MQFHGYIVATKEDGAVAISHYVFDDTELTPESKWSEAYGNTDDKDGWWGGIKLDAVLEAAKRRLHDMFESSPVC